MSDAFHKAVRGARADGHTVELRSREEIAAAIVLHDAAGENFRNELYRPAGAGLLGVAMVVGGAPVPARVLKRRRRPLVVVLADDHPGATGPDAWPQARKLLRWADAAVLHAAGGRAEEYAMIADAAIICGRLVLVEMEYRHMPAWMALAERHLPRLKVLRIEPKEGEHPIQGAPAGSGLQ